MLRERDGWTRTGAGSSRARRGEEPDGSEDLEKGDHVTWRTRGTGTEGTVTRTITEETEVGGRKVEAGADEPQYEVQGATSGTTAVHESEALDEQ
ncbi:MAG: uncharacterized protein JWQ53_251 [Klenkia sp.]|nr:uncharacterized protein [Klenkia sp.]